LSQCGKRMMRYVALIMIAVIILPFGCVHGEADQGIQRAAHVFLSTTPDDQRIVTGLWLMQKIDSGMANGLVIVDSRTEAEYACGHIPGAIHIPFKAAAEEENLARLPKGRLIVLVCKSGHTASMLNAILNMLGYQAVTLKDGMKGWGEVKSK